MADFENYMSPGRRGHLIGIGGVSMSSLAEVLLDMGLVISGSDSMESQNVRNLRELGIHIAIGHSAENITDDIEFVVRTAAVHDDNPEIVAAREKDIPVFERTQAWGTISRDYDNAICILFCCKYPRGVYVRKGRYTYGKEEMTDNAPAVYRGHFVKENKWN